MQNSLRIAFHFEKGDGKLEQLHPELQHLPKALHWDYFGTSYANRVE